MEHWERSVDEWSVVGKLQLDEIGARSNVT